MYKIYASDKIRIALMFYLFCLGFIYSKKVKDPIAKILESTESSSLYLKYDI